MPPALGAAGALPRNRYVSGIRSHEIDGNRGNQLRFDDATGKISSQLASDHGQSQLNLGYLTGGRVDGDASGRGEGAELRSDHAVAIRGESGVLITSEHSDSSSGNMLDVGRLTSLIDGLVKLAKDLGERATESAGESVTGAHIERAVQELAEFTHKPIPLVAVSGMAGIISATEAAFAVGAGKDIDLVSGAAATISAAENLSLRAVRDVSLYANEGSLRVTASEGKMSVQAQNDQMELLAKKVVEIISNSDWITIKAKKGVRINGGGTELELSPGGIKGYTSGKHHIHASDHQTFPGQNKQIQFPGDKAPHKVCVPCLVIAAQAHAPFAPTK
jgi:type VI secretion system secreted protein VgrG